MKARRGTFFFLISHEVCLERFSVYSHLHFGQITGVLWMFYVNTSRRPFLGWQGSNFYPPQISSGFHHTIMSSHSKLVKDIHTTL